MSDINTLADSVGFPVLAADTTSTKGVAAIAITGAAQSITFPKLSSGLYYKIRLVGVATAEIQCGLYVGPAAGAPTITLDAASPFANTVATRGATLYSGEFIDGIVPGSPDTNIVTSFHFIGRTAVGSIEVYQSTCLNTRQIRTTAA